MSFPSHKINTENIASKIADGEFDDDVFLNRISIDVIEETFCGNLASVRRGMPTELDRVGRRNRYGRPWPRQQHDPEHRS